MSFFSKIADFINPARVAERAVLAKAKALEEERNRQRNLKAKEENEKREAEAKEHIKQAFTRMREEQKNLGLLILNLRLLIRLNLIRPQKKNQNHMILVGR